MSSLTVSEARDHLSEVINRVAFGKERQILVRRGRAIAAVISIEDLNHLEDLEDQEDLEEAKTELKKIKKTKPWVQVKKEL